jgi:hypothetical protein
VNHTKVQKEEQKKIIANTFAYSVKSCTDLEKVQRNPKKNLN